MNNIIRMNQSEIDMAKTFYEKVKENEVTQGVVCYRDNKGNIKYQLYGSEHLTYILGLMERAKLAMCE